MLAGVRPNWVDLEGRHAAFARAGFSPRPWHGKDSPTFLASIGWNWMPTIPGRNIGIWDHVFLQQTGPVMLAAPFVHTAVAKDRQTALLLARNNARGLSEAKRNGQDADHRLRDADGATSLDGGIAITISPD